MRSPERSAFSFSFMFTILLFSPFVAASFSIAEERILRFESEIIVNDDGSAHVVETINVRAEGNAIKRGIFRDVLTKPGQLVAFEGAIRDGEPDGVRTEHRADRVRLYVGRKDRVLTKGNYTYQLTYSVSNVVGAFPDHDQLYWNVTGSNWAFPIDAASATVTFDADVPLDEIQARGFTGKEGDRGDASALTGEGEGAIRIETTRPLRAKQGLTIVAGIPKGYFTLPTPRVRALPVRTRTSPPPVTVVAAKEVFSNIVKWKIIVATGSVPITYFLLVWIFIGRDPLRGRVRTLFDPPRDISPATARFLTKQGYDRTTFTAAIIDMAAKGHVTIRREDDVYEIAYGSKDRSSLSPDEKVLSRSLGLSKGETLATSPANATTLIAAMHDHAEYLSDTYKGSHFTLNRGWWLMGCLIAMAAVAVPIAYFDAPDALAAIGAGSLLVLATGFTIREIARFLLTVRSRFALGARNTGESIGVALFFVLPGSVVSVVFIVLLSVMRYGPIAAMAVALGAVCWLFYMLLPAPSIVGRKALDQIEAFKRSLMGAGGTIANRVSSADAPAYFDERLAYAVALDVSSDWAKQFATILGGATDEVRYRPTWYKDPTSANSAYDVVDMSRFIGTGFAGAMNNVSPPMPEGGTSGAGGSSFGGGGFSGGGFGGGGFGGGGGFSGGGSGGGGGGGW